MKKRQKLEKVDWCLMALICGMKNEREETEIVFYRYETTRQTWTSKRRSINATRLVQAYSNNRT